MIIHAKQQQPNKTQFTFPFLLFQWQYQKSYNQHIFHYSVLLVQNFELLVFFLKIQHYFIGQNISISAREASLQHNFTAKCNSTWMKRLQYHPSKQGLCNNSLCVWQPPHSTFVRGQGITQGNDLNRRQSCNGNNNKESTRWSHSWDYEFSCLAFTLAEESSASLSTQLLNTSQGLHTISHTSTWKEAGKFS